MRAKEKKNLVKVGAFVVGLVAVGMVLVVAIGKEDSLFESKVTLRAHVNNADKLRTGSPAELKGLRIGHVADVQIIADDRVEITISIRESDLKWIKQDTQVSVSNAGLVGDKFLEFIGGTPEAPRFRPSKDILTGVAQLDFKAMAQKGSNIAETAERVLLKVETIVDGLDARKINQTVDGLAKTATHMAPAAAKMDRAMERMSKATERLDAVMARLQTGPGSAHSLIYDDALHADLRKLLGGAERNSVIKYFIRESIKKAPAKPE